MSSQANNLNLSLFILCSAICIILSEPKTALSLSYKYSSSLKNHKMPFALTLVASPETPALTGSHLARAQGLMDQIGLRLSDTWEPEWLSPHHAADIPIDDFPRPEQLRQIRDLLAVDKIDVFASEIATRRKKLLLADMDSTIITGETLDDLAAIAGVGEQVAAITERAMRGELDFVSALHERLQLIAGLPEQALMDVAAAQVFSPGALTLIKTLRHHHIVCVLVSGGFTFFTEAIAEHAGFHFHHGNVLDLADGTVTGALSGPIIDKEAKLKFLHDYALRLNIPLKMTAAIGDGANDLPMLQSAGLGVGYHPKALLRESLDALILYGDLTALLYAMGFRESEFVS